MELKFKHKYTHLSDKEIVSKIIAEPYNEEAAIYLIYDRYAPLCKSVCIKTLGGVDKLDQLQSELFILLKSKKQDWHALRSFQWRSSFGRWLSITTYNLSLELRKILIENEGQNISIDKGWHEDDEKPKTINIPVDEEEQRERRYRMVLLQEAINMLDNPDQKFVVINRLHGYSSKEVATMLQTFWDNNNIVRYNNKKEVVVPNSGYIDNLFKRGYVKTIQIYKLLNK